MPSASPPVFPLAPFLLGLGAVDIHLTLDDVCRVQRVLEADTCWTHARLRQVLMSLLAKNEQQREGFERLYGQFQLAGDEQAAYQQIDVSSLQQDLQQLITQYGSQWEQTQQNINGQFESGSTKADNWFRWVLVTSVLLIIGALVVFYWPDIIGSGIPSDSSGSSSKEVSAFTDLSGTEASQKPPVLHPKSSNSSLAWWLAALLSTLFSLFLWWWLRKSQQMPGLPTALHWQQDSEAYFDPASIGTPMPAWLSDVVLDECADSIGSSLIEAESSSLNIPATIKASAQAAGLPEVRMLPQRFLFHILVLVDVAASEQRWCPMGYELVTGLRQRGLPITLGHLYGNLREFRTDTGELIALESLAEERGHYIVVIFADTRVVDWQKDKPLLDELALWPQLVWLTLREQRFWTGYELSLKVAGIRLRVVEPNNLAVIFHELSEEIEQPKALQDSYKRFMGRGANELLTSYVQRLLGDTLPLARIVALLPPPVSPALLVRLLSEFSPHLSLTRIQRLYALPKTEAGAAGLHWQVDVLRLLRGQFHQCYRGTEKQWVKEKLLAWYQSGKPNNDGSLRYFSWYWRYLRLLLEFDPKQAIPQLEQLQLSVAPLQTQIERELQQNILPFPLPDPSDKENRKRLMRISKGKVISEGMVWPAMHFYKLALLFGLVLSMGLILAATIHSLGFFPKEKSSSQSENNYKYYIVQSGDTVFQVMRNTGAYWKDIIRLNNLTAPDYSISPGQKLIIGYNDVPNDSVVGISGMSTYYDYSGQNGVANIDYSNSAPSSSSYYDYYDYSAADSGNGTSYAIQVLASSNRSNADAMVSQMQSMGLNAVIDQVGGYYKVLLPFSSENEAKANLNRIRSSVPDAFYISLR